MKVLNLSELCHTVYEGKRNHQELAVLFHGTCLNEILLVGSFFSSAFFLFLLFSSGFLVFFVCLLLLL